MRLSTRALLTSQLPTASQVSNSSITSCETAVRPNHTKFVYMSSGYPEGYMCAYRPKSVIAQHTPAMCAQICIGTDVVR